MAVRRNEPDGLVCYMIPRYRSTTSLGDLMPRQVIMWSLDRRWYAASRLRPSAKQYMRMRLQHRNPSVRCVQRHERKGLSPCVSVRARPLAPQQQVSGISLRIAHDLRLFLLRLPAGYAVGARLRSFRLSSVPSYRFFHLYTVLRLALYRIATVAHFLRPLQIR